MEKYEALFLGLKIALEYILMMIESYGDSQLVINQVNDTYQTKNKKLLPYKHLVDTLKACFVPITFDLIPRDKNRANNAMPTLTSLVQLLDQHEQYEFLVEEVVQPRFTQPKSHIIFHLDTLDSPWYDSICAYLCDNVMHSNLSRNQKYNFI